LHSILFVPNPTTQTKGEIIFSHRSHKEHKESENKIDLLTISSITETYVLFVAKYSFYFEKNYMDDLL